MRLRVFMLIGVVMLLAAGLSAACSDSTDTSDIEARLESIDGQLTEIHEQTQGSAIHGALVGLRAAGLHELDEAANDEGVVPEGAGGQIDRALLAMASVHWPEALQADADALIAALEAAAEALDASTDAEDVAGPVREAHDAWHNFEHDASGAVSGGHDGDGESHDGEMEMEDGEEGTPMDDGS